FLVRDLDAATSENVERYGGLHGSGGGGAVPLSSHQNPLGGIENHLPEVVITQESGSSLVPRSATPDTAWNARKAPASRLSTTPKIDHWSTQDRSSMKDSTGTGPPFADAKTGCSPAPEAIASQRASHDRMAAIAASILFGESGRSFRSSHS